MIVVLDTGGIDRLAPVDDVRRARLRALRARASDVVLPAAVLAESAFTGHPGRDFHVRRLLDTLTVVDVDEALGYAAGSLRQTAMAAGASPPPSGVDAVVVAVAEVRATREEVVIVTSDRDDLELLGAGSDHAARLSVLVL